MSFSSDRREFLKKGLAATATVLSGGSLLFNPRESRAETLPDLVVANGSDPAEITRAAVNALGGMGRFVKPGNKVVIKPNMSFASGPASASNTHPAVVGEVARMCIQSGASKVVVIDNVLHTPEECLALSQIPAACGAIPQTTVNVVKSKRLYREVKVPAGRQLKSVEAVAEVLDSDVLIAVPVGKSHSASGVSLSMKGMMGLIYDRTSFHGRYDLHDAIVDMLTVLKPHLVVIDGTRILSTGGPQGPGKVIPLNLVIASADAVAADAQMLALGTWFNRKFEPHQVKHIRVAAERGLGRMDLQNLNVRNIRI
jgi:uncharacterized protein (DUF362 family)